MPNPEDDPVRKAKVRKATAVAMAPYESAPTMQDEKARRNAELEKDLEKAASGGEEAVRHFLKVVQGMQKIEQAENQGGKKTSNVDDAKSQNDPLDELIKKAEDVLLDMPSDPKFMY